MNTEITENIKGWVFYDGECPLCRRWVERTYALLLRRGYHFVPLQTAWAKVRLSLKTDEPLQEMKLLTARGEIFGGADALVEICGAIWWAWTFYVFVQTPGVKPLLRRLYCRLAANRHCFGGQCKIVNNHKERTNHVTSAFYEWP